MSTNNLKLSCNLFQNYHGHGNVLGQDFYFSNRITVSLAGLSFLLDEKDHMLVVISWSRSERVFLLSTIYIMLTTSTSWGDMHHVNLVLLCYNEDCATDQEFWYSVGVGTYYSFFFHSIQRSDPYFVLVVKIEFLKDILCINFVHFLLTTTCQLPDFLSPKDLLCINDCFMSLCKVTWKNASTRAITTILHQWLAGW
ncbi:hypothetical protein ACJX0J_028990, partial [Zea mays]